MEDTQKTTSLSRQEREAVAALCLLAAFADGRKHDDERARLQAIFADLDASFSPALYQKVVLGQTTAAAEAGRLSTRAARLLAYEMAVGVCDADGRADEAEQAFLDELSAALGLDAPVAQRINEAGDALATLSPNAPPPPNRTAQPADAAPLPAAEAADETASAVDAMILKYAVLNGGLELLPQSLATMAIVPLQTKMVYRIGRHHGYELDQGHVKELLAAVGLGMTSQVVETYARRLFGGFAAQALGGKGLGGMGLGGMAFGKKKKKGKKNKKLKRAAGKAAGVATGAAMSFATTYALGQAAKHYYAGSRQLGTEALRDVFSRQIERGQRLYQTHQGDVAASARATDLNALMAQLGTTP